MKPDTIATKKREYQRDHELHIEGPRFVEGAWFVRYGYGNKIGSGMGIPATFESEELADAFVKDLRAKHAAEHPTFATPEGD